MSRWKLSPELRGLATEVYYRELISAGGRGVSASACSHPEHTTSARSSWLLRAQAARTTRPGRATMRSQGSTGRSIAA